MVARGWYLRGFVGDYAARGPLGDSVFKQDERSERLASPRVRRAFTAGHGAAMCIISRERLDSISIEGKSAPILPGPPLII